MFRKTLLCVALASIVALADAAPDPVGLIRAKDNELRGLLKQQKKAATPERREKIKTLEHKRDELQKHYDSLSEEQQYAKHGELTAAKKAANDALLDVCNIIGGLITVQDLKPVAAAYEKNYKFSLERRNLREKRSEIQVRRDDRAYEKKDTSSYDAKLKEIDEQLKKLDLDIKQSLQEIDGLRAPHLQEPEFQKFDALYDLYGSNAVMNRFWVELSSEHRTKLYKYFLKDYANRHF